MGEKFCIWNNNWYSDDFKYDSSYNYGLFSTSVLKKFKVDPALASSIFVTTFTDVLGFFFFLGLATLLIQYLL